MLPLVLALTLTQFPEAEWRAPTTSPAGLTPPPLLLPTPRERYLEATALIASRRYTEAVEVLTALTQIQPTPEAYAARCSALLGAKRPAPALLDCRYAYARKPSLTGALYAQAMAEEQLGDVAAAWHHYTAYARLRRAEAPHRYRAEAARRAKVLLRLARAAPRPQGAPPVAAPPVEGVPAHDPCRGGAGCPTTPGCENDLDCDGAQRCLEHACRL